MTTETSGYIVPAGHVLDAAALDPGVRALQLEKKAVPPGELAKLSQLEYLRVQTYPDESLDLTGCRNLKSLTIRYCSKLQHVTGLEDALNLEFLTISTCNALLELPDLSEHKALRHLTLGPIRSARSLAPVLAAPELESLDLTREVPLAPGDAEMIRDHPTLAAFLWWPHVKVPTQVVRKVTEMVGKPNSLEEGRRAKRRAVYERLHGLTAGGVEDGEDVAVPRAADPLDIVVNVSTADSWGGIYPVTGVGPVMLYGAPDMGRAVEKIEIDLFPWQEAKGYWAKEIARYNDFRESSLPEIRFRRKARSVLIRGASSLDVPRLNARHDATVVEIFRTAYADTLQALHTLGERLTPDDDFNLDAFLAHCAAGADRIPDAPDALRQLIDDAEARLRRVVQERAAQTTFPGWLPGEPAPEGI